MGARMGIVVVVLAAALSACTDDPESSPRSGPEPSPEPTSQSTAPEAPLTEVTVPCPEFADTAQRIADAQAALYSGAGDNTAIDDLEAELDALKEGAPPDVQAALTDIGAGFRDAAELLEDPTPKNKARLADLASTLAAAGQKITGYITSKCS